MVAVPAATPLTTPLLLTVAIVSSELVQVPPGFDVTNAVVDPMQTELDPVMLTTGSAFTVTVVVVEFGQVPSVKL
jgi:hypothetical protein